MKIFIFIVFSAAFLYCLSTADIELSNDNSTVTTSGNVSHPNKDNSTNSNVGDPVEVDDDVHEEADDNTQKANHTLSNSPTTDSNSTESDVEDNDEIENSNSTLSEDETHNESNKTSKRHSYYVNTGYSQPLTLQLQQQQVSAPVPNDIYSYVDFRQSRRYAETIPGVEGRDYPIFASVPPTSFSCNGRAIGLYGDVEARCQVWHNCQLDGRRDAFLCPNGTLFNQQVLVCDWWYNVECETTPSYYGLNAQLVQQGPVASQLYHHNGYRQQINRYQDASGRDGGYYYNYQKPFYVQTTAYPTGYYFDTGRGTYSSSSDSSARSAASSAAAGSSFVSTNSLNGGSTGGYYYRPSYQRIEGGRATSSLGGYGYTVSSHTPGYVTMRYDVPGGQYASNAASSSAAGGFQYAYSTGQIPAGYSVPVASGSLNQFNQASRYQYQQRQTSSSSNNGDPIDHPNYNEKSGYNYRPPQIPIPRPIARPVVPVPTAQIQTVLSTQQEIVPQQPKISVPIQPLPAVTPSYQPIDHPNANEKSGYSSGSSRRGSQTTNYAFSTYGTNQNAQIPAVKPAVSTAQVQSVVNTQQQTVYQQPKISVPIQPLPVATPKYEPVDHPNANEKSGYSATSGSYRRGSQTANYAFSTYSNGQHAQIPLVKPAPITGSSGGQSTGYSYSTYSQAAESVHPNANEKSAYVQSKIVQPARPDVNYSFSTYESNRNTPVLKPSVGQTTYSRVSEEIHPNANEKSGYVRASVAIPSPANTQGGSQTTNYAFSSYTGNQNVRFPVIPAKQSQVIGTGQTYSVSTYNEASISHPNANEKSGYVSVAAETITHRPIVPVTYRPIVPVTYRPIVPVARPPTKVSHLSRDPIDHPNYNEKSGYNPRPVPIGTIIPPDMPRPKIVVPPPRVQVDCTGTYSCPPSASVNIEAAHNVHQNFGQRVESGPIRIVAQTNGAGSVAASDRSAGAVQQSYDGGY
ncbi:hypothetical protein CHUAL_005434 [Chamberlinius hualienensis]